MRLRPLAAEHKLSRGLFEQLAEQIKSGKLAPGERLPTEQELTRAARVSRTVVREAVAALRAEGLVITRQGVGAFVSASPPRAPPSRRCAPSAPRSKRSTAPPRAARARSTRTWSSTAPSPRRPATPS